MNYTYEILLVDEVNNVMDVEYLHEQHGAVLVGMETPKEGQQLDEVLAAYAPIKFWQQKSLGHWSPEVGQSGELYDAPLPEIMDYQSIHEGVSAIYSSAPKARLWSVEQIERLEVTHLRMSRFFSYDGTLKAIEVFGPTPNWSQVMHAAFLISVRKVAKIGLDLGVPIFAVTKSEEFAEFAKTHLSAEVSTVSGQLVLHLPWGENMQASRLDAYASEVRQQRDAKLSDTDWINQPDANVPQNKDAWLQYRQDLRDITGQSAFPTSVTWPIKP